ncbi:hypothetical protein ES703_126042 [subsurface metagenome]
MRDPVIVRVLNISIKLPARYISWHNSARRSKGPVVGKFSTIAVMVSPEIIAGSVQPIVLIIGLTATLTGYLNSKVLSATPLARATMTYCFLNSSSRQLLITRISPAVPAVPITIMGMGRCFNMSINLLILQAVSAYLEEKRPILGIRR